jgi:anti-sigma regulatory factor (Ser/Thr protein kinase)
MSATALRFEVCDASAVSGARRGAVRLAAGQGFDEADAGRVAIVATELATNLVKHGGGGEILVRPLLEAGALELLALDRGRGMADVDGCFRDGFSTAGSAGTGLGAVARLASAVDVYSVAGAGTAVLARVWPARSPRPPAGDAEVGAVSVTKPGQDVCGDGWAVEHRGDRSRVLVVDGLGHGPAAAAAAAAAVAAFHEAGAGGPADVVERLHAALRPTRGAAAAVAEIDRRRRVVRYCGVGNVSGVMLGGPRAQAMVSHPGTLGHTARRIAEFTYPWPEGGVLVLHSDGVSSRWTLDTRPGLAGRDPSLVAGVLYRDGGRGHDDATVVVLRVREAA